MSTFSSSLELTLIGTGQQAGAWGNTTNTNLQIIEQAIAGVVTITMSSANYTLTNTQGAVSPSNNMVLVVKGTNSGVFQVVTPLVTKYYVISNQTTGGYAITIGASTGTTVTIPNGTTTSVYCDGTNFYAGSTGVAGNFSVGGNETVAGTLGVTGNTSLGGTLAVAGATTLSGTTSLAGTATALTVTPSTDSSTKIATTAFVQSAATAAAQAAYPVGSIYMNASNSTTPATLLGFGTWTALGAGQMLLGAGTNSGNTFTAGSSGGYYAPQLLSHTHSATFTGNALGAHSHTLSYGPNGGGGLGGGDLNSTAGPTSTSSVSAGTPSGSVSVANASSGDQTLGNLPPYLTVYMWQRTA